MMINKKAIPSLIFILLATICTIISFSSYWYQERFQPNRFLVTRFYKYNGYYDISTIGGVEWAAYSGASPYSSSQIEFYQNRLSIFNASLAFCILAFIILFFSSLMYLIITIGAMEKIPIAIRNLIQQISKFIVIGGTICALLSMFIFLGIGPATRDDCSKSTDTCESNNFEFINTGGRDYQSPSTGWVTINI